MGQIFKFILWVFYSLSIINLLRAKFSDPGYLNLIRTEKVKKDNKIVKKKFKLSTPIDLMDDKLIKFC